MRRPPRETVSRSPVKPIVFPPVSFEEWREEAGASVDRDEQELLRRCRMGNQAASTALVETYAGMVGTVIWRATGDGAAVEDFVQEVFLRVFRALPDFGGRAKLSTWIYTIAHRVAIDHRRRVDRWRGDSGAGYDDTADLGDVDRWPTTTVIDPEAIAMQQQVGDLVRTGLAQLPDKYRLPLVYTSIEGLGPRHGRCDARCAPRDRQDARVPRKADAQAMDRRRPRRAAGGSQGVRCDVRTSMRS